MPTTEHPVRPSAAGAEPADTVSATNHVVGPQDFYTIYNENPLLTAASPINGAGVTVAVLEESAITASDVTQFRSTFAVTPAAPASLVVDTGYGANTCTAPAKISGEEGEAVLDIEWAGAVAPGANLIFMQCATTHATAGIFLSAEAVIDNNLADTMSLSYGVYEGNSTTEDNFVNMLWEQAAAQGETVVVSSGDDGSATEDGNLNDTVARYGISVNSFSSTNWNVSAGGTDFMDTFNGDEGDASFGLSTYWNSTNGTGLSSALSYIPETTWNDNCSGSLYSFFYYSGSVTDPAELCGANAITKNIVGGGGGPSKLSTRPRATWQTNTVYGLPSTATYPNRLQPDLSLFASNGFWGHSLPAYQSDDGGLIYAGGTSFVAPQLAGLFALVVQQTGQRQGQPNYVLYAMAGTEFGTTSAFSNACNGSGSSGNTPTSSSPGSSCVFYDIQTGNNSAPCTAGTTNCFTDPGKAYGILSTSTTTDIPAFTTNAGYDMATGIGSINITNLVRNWQSPSASRLFSPTVAVTSSVSTYVYGHPAADTLTAVVSGPGSFPTGSVTFSASPTVGAIGTAILTPSSGCATGGTCTESATQTFTPSGTLAVASYTVTGTYSSTNENYTTGSGTTTFSVTQQTPTVTVSSVSAYYETPSTTLTAMVSYTGSGLAPSGNLSLSIDNGMAVLASCTGSSSPRTCTASYDTASLSPGSHTVTASLAADTNYSALRPTPARSASTPTPSPASRSPRFPRQPRSTRPIPSPSRPSAQAARPFYGFTGTVTLTSTDSTACAHPRLLHLHGTADAGSKAFTVTFNKVGTYSVTATTGSNSASDSGIVVGDSLWILAASGQQAEIGEPGTAIASGVGASGSTSPNGGIAIDGSGNVWSVASATNALGFTTFAGVSTATYTGGGLSSPVAIAIDGSGYVWIANSGNSSVSEFSNTGAAQSGSGGYATASAGPSGIAIDNAGSVWTSNSTGNTMSRGSSAPPPRSSPRSPPPSATPRLGSKP